MPDIYSWILSPEIRDHLRANYPLSAWEKMQIICGAFRSIEEKESALRALLEEAEPGEAREQIQRLIRLYGLALEELRKTGPEHLYVLPTTRPGPNRTTSLVPCNASLFSSYAELLAYENLSVGPCLCASKWERVNGKWESAIEFDVQRVDGVFCTTRFWLSDEKKELWGIDEDTMYLQLDIDEMGFGCTRYPIPFQTGDLVKLNAPMLEKPLFGVMDNVLDLNGANYLWMGYVKGDYLDLMSLSDGPLHYTGGYRAIDWLHSARPEELPEDEKILREIGEYLSSRPQRDSDVNNGLLDIFGVEHKRVFRRWTETSFQELLAQVREERGARG